MFTDFVLVVFERAVQVILWYYSVLGTGLKTGAGPVSDNSCAVITPVFQRVEVLELNDLKRDTPLSESYRIDKQCSVT